MDYQAEKRPTPPMTATVMNEIFSADDAVQAGESAINSLNYALELNKTAIDGPFAEQRAYGSALFGGKDGQDTLLLRNEVTSQALAQLKSIFGAAPTEGERKILMEIQGSADQPRAVREAIFTRAIEAAERRTEYNRANAGALRSGTYFDPGFNSPPMQTNAGQTSSGGIDDLLTKYQ